MVTVLDVSRASSILMETMVLVCTWIKTFKHWREARRLRMASSISSYLLRDGQIYSPRSSLIDARLIGVHHYRHLIFWVSYFVNCYNSRGPIHLWSYSALLASNIGCFAVGTAVSLAICYILLNNLILMFERYRQCLAVQIT